MMIKIRSHRRQLTLACTLTLFLAAGGMAAWSHSAAAGGNGPDVTVFSLPSTFNWGSSDGFRAYSVATTSCNIGNEPLMWCDENLSFCDSNEHPVIGQNMYRLKDGRFEQIGMSWLKHGFLSLNLSSPECGNGTCIDPPEGGRQLGVGCTDPYGSQLNGFTPLGPRSEVNATTGSFPFPHAVVASPTVVDQRMKVAEADLDPALNEGALYWVEGQYIAPDDAVAENGLNNASYRAVTVSEGSFSLNMQGSTVRETAAIFAWRSADPEVEIVLADVQGSRPLQRYHVGRRVTGTDTGWHYEYAIHNMNSDRSARSFTIQFPPGTVITDAGFHDIEHHSGEDYATTDWDVAVNNVAGTVSWSTDTFAVDELANALRWGSMFTFWVDASASPVNLQHSLGLFKPGFPASVQFSFTTGIFADGFESGNTSRWSSGG